MTPRRRAGAALSGPPARHLEVDGWPTRTRPRPRAHHESIDQPSMGAPAAWQAQPEQAVEQRPSSQCARTRRLRRPPRRRTSSSARPRRDRASASAAARPAPTPGRADAAGHQADRGQRDRRLRPGTRHGRQPEGEAADGTGGGATQRANTRRACPARSNGLLHLTKTQADHGPRRLQGFRVCEERDVALPRRRSICASLRSAIASAWPGRDVSDATAASVPSACSRSATSRASSPSWSRAAMLAREDDRPAPLATPSRSRPADRGGGHWQALVVGLLDHVEPDELVSVTRHGPDEPGFARVVFERPPQRADRLRQRAVGYDHLGPHLREDGTLRDGLPAAADEQVEEIEIPRDQRKHDTVSPQHALPRRQHELAKAKPGRGADL